MPLSRQQARQLGPRPGAAITTLTSLANFRPKRPAAEPLPLEWGDPAGVAAAERLIRRFLARSGLAAHLTLVRTGVPESPHPDPTCASGTPSAARAPPAGADEAPDATPRAPGSVAARAPHAHANSSVPDASAGVGGSCCDREGPWAADIGGDPGRLVVSGAAGAAHMRLELRLHA